MNSQKTILFIEAGTSGKGGSFVSLLQMLKLLSKKQYRLVVLLWNYSPFMDQYRTLGAEVFQINNALYTVNKNKYKLFYNKLTALLLRLFPVALPWLELFLQLNAYKQMKKIVQRFKVDFIHLNNQPLRNFIGFWLAKHLNIPVVCHLRTLHGYGLTQAHINFLKQLNVTMIAVSNAAAEYWEKKGIPGSWIKVIYNPYDGKLVKQWLTSKPFQKKIIYIGRIEKTKGVDYLLEAFKNAQSTLSDLSLTIIGDGAYYQTMKEKAHVLGITNKISFLGYINDAKQLLPQYDVLVMPSAIEGFGRVLVEAMAVGIPVISTHTSGINEIITDHFNGLLTPYGDVSALTRAIIELVQNRSLRREMQENAYYTVCKKFQEDEFYKKLLSSYNALAVI